MTGYFVVALQLLFGVDSVGDVSTCAEFAGDEDIAPTDFRRLEIGTTAGCYFLIIINIQQLL